MNKYNTDLIDLTCSCKDWQETRKEYSPNDPRRLCKHIIAQIDINNLSSELKYFKESIIYYQDHEYGFRKDFEKVVYIEEADCKVLYAESGWNNIFDSFGKKYGLLILEDRFQWAQQDGKPQKYSKVEEYFDKDEYLPAIELFDEEIVAIKSQMLKSGYKNISILQGGRYEVCANSLVYDLDYQDNNDENCIIVSNEDIQFETMFGEGFTSSPILRNENKVNQSLELRKENRK